MIEKKIAQTEYSIIDNISHRWSPRAFAEKPVEEEKILRVLEAARWAASSNNEQPWRFIIARKGEAHYDKLFEGFNKWNKKWAWTAPVIGVTIAKKHFTKDDSENKHSWHDVGLAMGNLLAQATEEELYLHQMAGIDQDEVRKNFNIDNEFDVVAMFAMGYQDESRLSELDERYHESEYKQRSRKAMKDIVFGEKFGVNPEWIK